MVQDTIWYFVRRRSEVQEDNTPSSSTTENADKASEEELQHSESFACTSTVLDPKKSAFTVKVTYGFFSWTGNPHCPISLCLICGKQLTNTAMVDYFKRLLESQSKQSTAFIKRVSISKKAQEASYKKEKVTQLMRI